MNMSFNTVPETQTPSWLVYGWLWKPFMQGLVNPGILIFPFKFLTVCWVWIAALPHGSHKTFSSSRSFPIVDFVIGNLFIFQQFDIVMNLNKAKHFNYINFLIFWFFHSGENFFEEYNIEFINNISTTKL